jgi:hypothetical protein
MALAQRQVAWVLVQGVVRVRPRATVQAFIVVEAHCRTDHPAQERCEATAYAKLCSCFSGLVESLIRNQTLGVSAALFVETVLAMLGSGFLALSAAQ